MNCEIIKTLAADAITEFSRTHITACVLSVSDGLVTATPIADMKHNYKRCLQVTVFAQNSGLTNAHWKNVGEALYNLYTQEQKCRPHQKH